MQVLITGAAGFIGAALAKAILARGDSVIGIDNFDDYYAPSLKRDRTAEWIAAGGERARMLELDFADNAALTLALDGTHVDAIVHLGAQAGVRYSLENPHAYVKSNLVGHVNMLELARARRCCHMVYCRKCAHNQWHWRVEPPGRRGHDRQHQ